MPSQWPNGQGVGFRSRRLWVRVPSGMPLVLFCVAADVRVHHCSNDTRGARSVMVIIGASQALDPGSIPGERKVGH